MRLNGKFQASVEVVSVQLWLHTLFAWGGISQALESLDELSAAT